jgi:hypothetical protein
VSDERGPVWRKPRDRDVRTEKHAVPNEFRDEPATGRIDITPEELQRIRARRPTPERISKLEAKHDALALSVAKMDGKIDALHGYAVKADAERERRAAADAVALERRRKHAIALITALGGAIAAIVAAWVMR